MAIQFEGPARVDIGSSRIRPRDVSQFQRGFGDNGAGDQMAQLAKSLEGLSGAYSALEQRRIQEDEQNIDLYVAQAAAGMGDGPFDSSVIDDMFSDKHATIRARIAQGVGAQNAQAWIQSRVEAIPTEIRDDPMLYEQEVNRIRAEALAEVKDKPFYANGFVKIVDNTLNQFSANASTARAAKMYDVQDAEYEQRLANGDPEIDRTFSSGNADAQSDALLREFEGFRETPYWDVNAYRTGYGSDTITTADGKVIRVQPGMRVSKEDAERDLSRRRAEFQQGIIGTIGEDQWSGLSAGQKAALTSIAYNYGSLPKSVARALKAGGGTEAVAKAIEGLKGHNGGVNAKRRQKEANIFRNGGSVPVKVAGANSYIPRDNYEDAQMIVHRFGVLDPEFKVTSSLTNARRRDVLANTLYNRALMKGDASYLDAMPAELMTPALEEKFFKAREQIEETAFQKNQRQRTIEAQEQADRVKNATSSMINDRADGTFKDPVEYATGPDGKIDPALLEAVLQIPTTFVDARTSQQNASNLKNTIMSAAASNDWTALKNQGLTFEGDSPTTDDMMTFIRTNPTLNDTDRKALMESAESDIEKGAFVSHPRVQARLKDVEEMVDLTLKSNLAAPAALAATPDIKLQVKKRYERVIAEYVADNGIPAGGMSDLLDKAEAESKALLQELMSMRPGQNGANPPATQTATPTGSPVGTVKTGRGGKQYRKKNDGPDADRNNWEEVN